MFLVGIAGGSGSGKTTFTKKILTRVGSDQIAIVHQDSYYLADPSLQPAPQKSNFDHPGAFDWPLLRAHLAELKKGHSVDAPTYDYTISKRKPETEKIGPCQVILVEGLFTLWDAELRSLFDIKVFLNVDADIRFIRRLHRDVRERGRSLDSIIHQYYDTVRPMHHEFLDPTRQYADIIVGEETDIAADALAARIQLEVFQ